VYGKSRIAFRERVAGSDFGTQLWGVGKIIDSSTGGLLSHCVHLRDGCFVYFKAHE
jgi:hypothetical protein